MQLSTVISRAARGMDAPCVRVETHLSNGLPSFTLVGLPETAVREARERVRSAILNSHLEFPDRRITINLSPADLPKSGGRFDLPIALGILVASGQLPARSINGREFIGELALDGELRAVPGIVSAAFAATEAGRSLHLPGSGAELATLVPEARIIACPDLLTLCAHLNGNAVQSPLPPDSHEALCPRHNAELPDMADVIGQAIPRRALEVAAAGQHHLLLCGPPGTGKTLLAERLPGILPPPTIEELLPTLALHELNRKHSEVFNTRRPFRQPHHSASAAALVGGGTDPRPGEVSLANGGVLFMDELPEFPRNVLNMLREPLESGAITLSRARHKVTFPARFQLVAAMNPCPCGYHGDPQTPCRCTPDQIQRYRGKVSGPLLDRIDIHVTVARQPVSALTRAPADQSERSATVLERVCAARERQWLRQGCLNARLPHDKTLPVCGLSDTDLQFLEQAAQRLQLSGRALHRLLRVARTAADIAAAAHVQREHLSEALGYRCVNNDAEGALM